MSMTRLIHFMRSDLFLSLVGGFALGVAGMTWLKPATAVTQSDNSRSISVEAPVKVVRR